MPDPITPYRNAADFYMVYEYAEDDLGSRKEIVEALGVSNNDIKRLKNSARKSAPIRSVKRKRLISEKSVFEKCGPERGVRLAVPSWPNGAWVKQLGLNHC